MEPCPSLLGCYLYPAGGKELQGFPRTHGGVTVRADPDATKAKRGGKLAFVDTTLPNEFRLGAGLAVVVEDGSLFFTACLGLQKECLHESIGILQQILVSRNDGAKMLFHHGAGEVVASGSGAEVGLFLLPVVLKNLIDAIG